MPFKNDREIFEFVKNHLLTQNAVSTYGITCQYRSRDGLKCAVGCLISDDAYNPCFEGVGVNDSVIHALEDSGVVFHKHTLVLLENLQNLHDRIEPEQWADDLQLFQFDENNDYIDHYQDDTDDEDGEECPNP